MVLSNSTENIERYLNSFGDEVVRKAKINLSAAGKGGGNLEKSIKFKLVPEGNDFVVQFMMADYGTFVDKGVKGAGGTIKTSTVGNEGSWGGRRWYTTWEGKRKDSPYKYGTGTGKKGGLSKGIASFVSKKNINRSSVTGKFITATGIKIAIVRTIWIKGIHGISFFQNSLMLGMKDFKKKLAAALKQDIIDAIKKNK